MAGGPETHGVASKVGRGVTAQHEDASRKGHGSWYRICWGPEPAASPAGPLPRGQAGAKGGSTWPPANPGTMTSLPTVCPPQALLSKPQVSTCSTTGQVTGGDRGTYQHGQEARQQAHPAQRSRAGSRDSVSGLFSRRRLFTGRLTAFALTGLAVSSFGYIGLKNKPPLHT